MTLPSSQTKFFEIPPERFNGKIPFIVTNILDALSSRNAQEVEGIFRLAGNERQMVDLIARFNSGPILEWPEAATVHTIASLLKRYLRKMADHDGLIPTDLYDTVIATMCARDPTQKVAYLKVLIPRLPIVRRKILAFLCRYWHTVIQSSAANKMNISNLSVCVSQAILIAPKGLNPMEMQRQVALGNEAMACLISHCDEIFCDVVVTPADFCTQDDIETLRAPKLNITNVNHFIVRNTFRRESLIPWRPACRVELQEEYQRPTQKPIKVEVRKEESGRLLTPAKMRLVLKSAFGIPGRGDFDSHRVAQQPDETTEDDDKLGLVFNIDVAELELPKYEEFTMGEEGGNSEDLVGGNEVESEDVIAEDKGGDTKEIRDRDEVEPLVGGGDERAKESTVVTVGDTGKDSEDRIEGNEVEPEIVTMEDKGGDTEDRPDRDEVEPVVGGGDKGAKEPEELPATEEEIETLDDGQVLQVEPLSGE